MEIYINISTRTSGYLGFTRFGIRATASSSWTFPDEDCIHTLTDVRSFINSDDNQEELLAECGVQSPDTNRYNNIQHKPRRCHQVAAPLLEICEGSGGGSNQE